MSLGSFMSLESFPSRKALSRPWLTILATTVLAGAVLRFLFPGDVPFGGDEAFALVLGGDWLQHPRIVLHGMSSSAGVPNPPLSVYFFAGIYALSRGDPQTASMVVMGWNVAGLILAGMWLHGRRTTLGPFWAWWVLAFLCVHPWSILLSRKIWAQDLLMPFVVIACWGLEGIWADRWRWKRVGAGVAAALIVSQIHISGIFWVVALAVGLAVYWPRAERRRIPAFLLLTGGIFLVLYTPWFIHLIREGSGYHPAPGETGRAGYLWNALCGIVSLLGVWSGHEWSLRYFFFTPEEAAQFYHTIEAHLRLWLLTIMLTGWQLMALPVITVRMIRRGKVAGTATDTTNPFLLSLFLFLLLVVLPGGTVYPHYGAVLIVPAAILLAQALIALESRRKDRFKERFGERFRDLDPTRFSVCIGVLMMLWASLSFLAHIHSTGGTLGDYGATLRVKQEKIAEMRREGTKRLSPSAPLEYHYLLDRLQGVRTRLEDHPGPFVEPSEQAVRQPLKGAS